MGSRFNSLSGRFLGLTVLFVLVAEVLIFVPSVARFRRDYLQNRIELAQLAALARLATPDEAVSPDLESELLDTAEVLNVVLRRTDIRELVLASPMPEPVDETFVLEAADSFTLMRDALRVFRVPEDRIIRVIGRATQGSGAQIEVTLHEWPLRNAMVDYGLRILYLSLAISMATAALLFFAVRRFIVRPIKRVVASMTAYHDDPEDPGRIIEPQEGARELRQAETALHDLQVRLTAALRQKERLAALGGAVAKISHDLRNLLATAQILADRIEASTDPGVRRTAPKLVHSLARAIALCERTLAFGRAEEPAPVLAVIGVAALAAEVVESERLAAADACVEIATDIPPGLQARADADQLYRVLSNLVRNAVQAIDGTCTTGKVTISGEGNPGRTVIRVSDTGPGLPDKARENLFQPFRGGVRQGGFGLGLVISSELVRLHGGSLSLAETGPGGTTFRIELPAP